MARVEPPALTVGDACWLLLGVLLYEVEITDVRVVLPDEPERFRMYRVKSRESSRYFEDRSHHRSDLFLKPQQRQDLLNRLECDMEALGSLYQDLDRNTEQEPEDA